MGTRRVITGSSHERAVGRLLRGLLASPYTSLRETFVRFALFPLVIGVWAAVTTKWLILLACVTSFALLLGLGLCLQYRAEVTGLVELEREEREEVFAKRAAWPPWKRRLFYTSLTVAFLGLMAWEVWTDFIR